MTAQLVDLLTGPVEDVARRLLGWRLHSHTGRMVTSVMLTEVEAYGGPDDLASHASRGPTARNASMFGPAGTLYVYRSYGIHWCANVVTGPVGEGAAVLMRGAVPLEGISIMEKRRRRTDHLVDGPGKLCQALGIVGEHDGSSLLDGPIRLLPPEEPINGVFAATPRIGVSKATDRLWRYVVRNT
ncbi:MAG: DNA-3-methyladenine glycosylase [Acidimicrobiia bacterium]|nr:DNA-3-methyladenine glycosylase [Acidimicrobiia bacterium]